MIPKRILTIVAVILAAATSAAADERCVKHEKYSAVTYVLIDRTDPTGNPEALEATLHSVEEVLLEGERLIVGVSTGAVGDTRVVMDSVKPTQSVWDSAIKVRAQQKAFKECVESVKKSFHDNSEKHPKSALLETLVFAGSILQAGPAEAKRRLVMYSDMLQNTDALSFWGKNPIVPDSALKQAEKKGLMATLQGVEVYVAGIGSGATPNNPQALQEFWKKYFAATGATLKFYGPMLLGLQ